MSFKWRAAHQRRARADNAFRPAQGLQRIHGYFAVAKALHKVGMHQRHLARGLHALHQPCNAENGAKQKKHCLAFTFQRGG